MIGGLQIVFANLYDGFGDFCYRKWSKTLL